MATMIIEPRLATLLTVDELAEYLGLKRQTIYRWRTERRGPRAMRIGNRLFWNVAEVDAWAETRTDRWDVDYEVMR
jgi:excisionase family DNA binding protein